MLKHNIYKELSNKELEYQNIFAKYKMLALNMFEWKGLPKGLESRHIEKALFDYGAIILMKPTKDEIGVDGDFIILGATSGANMNILGEPTQYIGNGYGKTFIRNIDECVVGWNNELMRPTILMVEEFTTKMFEVNRSIRANIIQQKFPFLIPCKTETELTLKNMYKKIMDGELVIFGADTLSLDSLQVLNTNVPYVADKLNEYKFELDREILSYFGLNNNFEKKERLLTDEINSNNDFIASNIDLMLKTREEFCRKAKEKYGLNITVSKKYDVVYDDSFETLEEVNHE